MIELLKGYGTGIAIGFALAYAIKVIPNLVSKYTQNYIQTLLNKGGVYEDVLLLTHIWYAEHLIGKGAGKDKFKIVANKMIAGLPVFVRVFITKNNPKIIELINKTVAKFSVVLKSNSGTTTLIAMLTSIRNKEAEEKEKK